MERGESLAETRDKLEKQILKENNWEQVKNIFQSVIDRPLPEREQFLLEACRHDESMLHEVRQLLDSFEEDDSFFERAAVDELAEFIVNSDQSLPAGTRLGRYRVKSELGAGGMGRVFLAEDTELERLVALKILSPIFANEAVGIRRFIQEARSASGLNHPNILTIHEIGQFESLRFIATEYVQGETLRQKLQQKALDLREILDIIAQAAGALNAAHEAKIIHRDIKPENIMIRHDGLVKVLDFGLAKLVRKNQEPLNGKIDSSAWIDTTPGLILGTVAYMSPEQARGRTTDARTDIWSLGVCLYEMIAGVKPFTGETNSDTIASILRSEPQPLEESVPAGLRRFVQKALEKESENRYQTIKDFLADLKDSERELYFEGGNWNTATRPSAAFNHRITTNNTPVNQSTNITLGTTGPIIEGKRQIKNNILFALFAVLFLGIAASGGIYYFISASKKTPTFETMRFAKLTYSGNVVGERVAISPDGKYTVYAVQEGGDESLWVRHTETSGNLQIVPPAQVQYGGLAFSPDGNYVYYSMMEKKGVTALYKVPVLGGEARKLLDNVERPVTFSPDGKSMAVVRDERLLMTADPEGGNLKVLATASEGKRWNLLAWSPDGRIIVGTLFSAVDNNTHLVEISLKDGTEKPLNSPPWMRISGMAWLPDGNGLTLSGRDLETKISQIWLITYPEGEIKRLTNDLNHYLGLSLTADGKTIASIQYERVSNIWSASREDARLTRQITFDKDKDEGLSGVALAPDGKIVYTARMTGTPDLWIVNPDGSGKRQLTFNARSNFSPAISPDNRYIAFISDRAGSSSVWRMEMDGGNPKQLTNSPGIAALPTFSKDGKWIIYQFTGIDNKPTIWKVDVEGSTAVQLTEVYSLKPAVSPDGGFFACYYGEPTKDSRSRVAVIPMSGGEPVKLFDLPLVVKAPIFRWALNGQEIIYADNRDRVYNLWSQSLTDRPPVQLTEFSSEEIFRFDVGDSGGDFVLVRGHESSDVIVIDNFK